MFYDTDANDHGLPFDPYKSIVVPRPIGWISTLDREGNVNLAPYSQFNNLGYDPPYVMFASTGPYKDSALNAVDTGEFVCNMATWELREAVNQTSTISPRDVDEAAACGLEMVPSRIVAAPRVKASPVHLECRYFSSLTLPGRDGNRASSQLVIGRVVGVHVADEFLTDDGRIDILKARPLARLGYHDYTSVEKTFAMAPPGDRLARGLEGRPRTAGGNKGPVTTQG